MTDIWPQVHAARAALAADLGSVTAWDKPSLCEGWTVHDVLAHMVSTATMSPPKFFGGFLASGFNFGKFADKGVAKAGKGGPAATVEAFRAAQTSTTSPPGPKTAWLGETIIHGEDIRRPLGIVHAYDPEAVRTVLEFQKGSNTLIGAKDRIASLTLKATDLDWTHGSGPLVEGPAISLLMAMTGRKAHLDDLSGDGVATLRGR